MRLLIGTLHAGENEFEACCRSIQRQSHQDFEHFTVEGKPHREAHKILYETFMQRAGAFDLFLKVDADMVIADRELFADLIAKFRENEWMDMFQIKVHDWFTDRLVWGMHVYRSGVRWPKGSTEQLFPDAPPVPPERRLNDDGTQAPRVLHGPDPSPSQAFRFGVNKGVKVMQPGQDKHAGQARAHLRNIERLSRNFCERGDRRLGLALLGAQEVLRGHLAADSMNDANAQRKRLFEEYARYDLDQIKARAARLRRQNFAFVGSNWRLALLWYLRAEQEPLSKRALQRLGKHLVWAAKRSAAAGRVRDNPWVKRLRRRA